MRIRRYRGKQIRHFFNARHRPIVIDSYGQIFAKARSKCYEKGAPIEEYFADYLAITELFHDENIIRFHLDRLETKLQQYSSIMRKDVLAERDDGKLYLPLTAPNIYKRHKILSSVLKKWAGENGFEQYTTIIRGLTRKEFASQLIAHSFLKDSANTTGQDHGVWSHALQWYCIIEQQHIKKYLRHTPQEIYQSFAPIWNLLIDSFYGESFHSPEFWTELLLSREAADRWPLLSGSIVRTQAKMHSHLFDYQDYLRNKYGEKQYRRGYGNGSL